MNYWRIWSSCFSAIGTWLTQTPTEFTTENSHPRQSCGWVQHLFTPRGDFTAKFQQSPVSFPLLTEIPGQQLVNNPSFHTQTWAHAPRSRHRSLLFPSIGAVIKASPGRGVRACGKGMEFWSWLPARRRSVCTELFAWQLKGKQTALCKWEQLCLPSWAFLQPGNVGSALMRAALGTDKASPAHHAPSGTWLWFLWVFVAVTRAQWAGSVQEPRGWQSVPCWDLGWELSLKRKSTHIIQVHPKSVQMCWQITLKHAPSSSGWHGSDLWYMIPLLTFELDNS